MCTGMILSNYKLFVNPLFKLIILQFAVRPRVEVSEARVKLRVVKYRKLRRHWVEQVVAVIRAEKVLLQPGALRRAAALRGGDDRRREILAQIHPSETIKSVVFKTQTTHLVGVENVLRLADE